MDVESKKKIITLCIKSFKRSRMCRNHTSELHAIFISCSPRIQLGPVYHCITENLILIEINYSQSKLKKKSFATYTNEDV